MPAYAAPLTHPLSTAQTEIWLAQQLHEDSPVYNIAQYTVIHGGFDLALFKVALRQVVAEVDSLHLHFVESEEGLRQYIGSPAWSLSVVDFRAEAEPQAAAEAWMRADYEQPVNILQGPLFHYALLKITSEKVLWYQRYHHIIMDGYGYFLIAQRVAHVYSAICEGVEPEPCPFGSVLQLLKSDAQYRACEQWTRDEAYWSERYTDWTEPATLASRSTPAVQHRLRQTAYLPCKSIGSGATNPRCLSHFILAALAAYLCRLTGEQNVVLGFVVKARFGVDQHVPGMASNILPIQLTVKPDMDLSSVIQQAARGIQCGLQYQRYRSETLRRKLKLAPGQPLFSTIVNVMPFDYDLSFGGHASESHNLLLGPADDLMVAVHTLENNHMLRIDFDANPACYTTDEVIAHQRCFVNLLKTLATSPAQLINSIDLLDAVERQRLLVEWNATECDYPAHLCIHQLFEAQVTRTPGAIALVFEEQTLSYAELNTRANRLAHQLIELGVKPDARVAICAERSPAMVVGLLAILKAGGAYVPLDPAYPSERLTHILADTAPAIALADTAGQSALGDTVLASLTVLDPNILPERAATNPQVPELTAHHLAYVIYTSGSTGTPKGVMVEHAQIVHLFDVAKLDDAQKKNQASTNHPVWMQQAYGLTPDDRVLQKAPFTFDVSVWECFCTLLNGATLVVAAPGVHRDPSALIELMIRQRITTVHFVPSMLSLFLSTDGVQRCTAVRRLLCTGEALTSTHVRRCQSLLPHAQLHNLYGPTEATIGVAAWTCPAEYSEENIPIGRPIANNRLYLLDKHGQPVPLGATGELYISGASVVRGYMNCPGLTAERFLLDPFSDREGARMYKTGDLARYRADGNLEFLGRNDHQIKIRGLRIELGEIKTCLVRHPLVREAAVLALGEGMDKRLVAYVVAKPDHRLAHVLRAYLTARLPEYMVPAAFVRLDALPLTPNGKLDRRALPEPDADALALHAYEVPQGELETMLATIWAELLGVERVGRHDSFFALGGHSLLAVRLMNRVRTLGADVPLASLFASPTLAAFAAVMSAQLHQSSHVLPEITPLSREGRLPLSFAQQRLWFLAQLDGVSYTYHIPIALRLRGPLDQTAWQQALNALFARHEALRSTFVSVDGQPQVQLLAPDVGLPLLWHDWRGVPDAETRLARLSADEAQTRFDLAHGPLIRAQMVQLADDEHRFLLTQHHIVSDGWSFGVLVRELSALYAAYCAGEADPLPPLSIQYPDYAAWQRQWLSDERLQHQSDYWRRVLAEAPVLLELPTDRHRPAQQSFAGAHVPVCIDAETTHALKCMSHRHGTTLFMTVLAAWGAVLSRLSGQNDVVIGTPSANRNHPQIEPLIGFFVNTLALRMDLSGEPDITELLTRARQCTLQAQVHQDLPFEQVVEIVQPPRRLNHTPLFQVMFAWQQNAIAAWKLPGLQVLPVEPSCDVVKFDLELSLQETSDAIIGQLEYSTALFDRSTIERHVGYLQTMLYAMVADARQSVARIELLAPEENKLVLQSWNATQRDYPAHLCIHQLFEAQAAHAPDATALIYDKKTVNYAELNAQANRLARQLIERGVQSDARVAICVERSIAMVVGLLAILKAGGAYVPLDPTYPAERLAYILADSAPTIVLADAVGYAALGDTALASCTVLDPNVLPALPDTNPQVPGLTARHLAYVIYTSGSTGTPKGVMVEHRSVVNLVTAAAQTLELTVQDRMLQFSSLSFDTSVGEIFTFLTHGATVVLSTKAWLTEGQQFWKLCKANRLSVVDLPVQFWAQLVQEKASVADSVRAILIGGDALSASAHNAWFSCSGYRPRLLNAYGPTETTIAATIHEVTDEDGSWRAIGRPLANTRLYILNAHSQPVPLGAVGELYIGGAGVARGYLNRPELTAERFVPDPFSAAPDARMYKTGDLARYLPNGNLEYLGRNDQQVKIRGFRIEPSEIEARLTEHPQVRDAVVLARGEGNEKRLIAYVVAKPDENLVSALRAHVAACLPEYMVPTAFVRLDAFPLTPNGKLDRRALPMPNEDAFAHQAYEAPQGKVETALAAIWAELLGVERVSRHDSFFALGGHSLLAVQLIERLRRRGLGLSVRALFDTPTLSALAQSVGQQRDVMVPPNVITPDTIALTPEMLPLIKLTQSDIDRIVEQVPKGVANIQDIYALSPLQDGILFHHLLASDGDPYLLIVQLAFDSRALLDRYLHAVQQVIHRHDILRTAFIWQELSTPAQVVWRHAPLSVIELALKPADGPIAEQLVQRFDPRQHRLDLTRAPLLRFVIAQDIDGRWLMVQLLHHLIGDHSTGEIMHAEVQAFLEGRGDALPTAQPFRNLVAQTRLGFSEDEHTRFFTDMLADVDEPTLPFGLADVHRDGDQITEAHQMLPQVLNDRLRIQAKRSGVSLASLCHLAWARVLACASGQQQVVFGTVLLGRMQAGGGADQALGLFLNVLPLCVNLNGSVRDSLRDTHARLAALLEHEHASLALAQRCSGVPAGSPLFSALLNHRHNSPSSGENKTAAGIEFLGAQERTNYPLTLSVEDFGTALGLTVQVVQPIDPDRVCGYVHQALASLANELETAPDKPAWQLQVLPEDERKLLLQSWNATQQDYPSHLCIHQMFEAQVERTPEATALVYEDQTLSYAELNAWANRLAHQLIELGVKPDACVVICVERSLAMVVGLLAILKAGGAYVPLDPAYPGERLTHILTDAAPDIVLADVTGRAALGDVALAFRTVLDPNELPDRADTNPSVPGLTARHLAYVIYTSGSTGMPKGVMVEHAQVTRLFEATQSWYHFDQHDTWCLFHSFAFDFSVWELWGALRYGGKLIIVPHHIARSPDAFYQLVCEQRITVLNQTPSAFKALIASQAQSALSDRLRYVIFGGEALEPTALQAWYAAHDECCPQLVNMYGITETTVHVTYRPIRRQDSKQASNPIGVRIPDLKIYLFDVHGQPVPLGAVGELYIGGAGVARGYLNRPELTAERFVRDPFSDEPEARMYKTGDLARYLPDGNLEYLGRADDQVKVRGFRIEPGEIKACLMQHAQVRDAVVLVRGEGMDKRLVAYVVAEADEVLASTLRAHVAARLPEYMVPAAFVRLDTLPLTPNGKLDRRALPEPDAEALAHHAYEAPQGELETTLATIWAKLLGVERVGRHDSFFALGGHSLLAVQLIELLRRRGFGLSVRALFDTPVLSALAQSLVQHQHSEVAVPANVITPETTALVPSMLPLIELTQADIDRIVMQVPGGVANIQDVYALSPLQDGILFHHLLASDGDPYLQFAQLAFDTRARLDQYLEAVQQVVNRHDILRSAFVWKGVSTPAQVVWRHATLSVTELALNADDGPIAEQLARRFDPHHYRLDLTQAPLLRFAITQDTDGRWLAIRLMHHLIDDVSSLQIMHSEVQMFIAGRGQALPAAQPFRNLVAQARLGLSQEAHKRFFTEMLADVEEPTLPFGLKDVHHDSAEVTEAHRRLPPSLNDRLRMQARHLGVSLASLCHLAWAQVLARASGQQSVVFGTVLFGRMHVGDGAASAMGLFINTLPLRLELHGNVQDSVRATHAKLAALLEHEHASLALAQRCSGMPVGMPLFSALLNYRHIVMDPGERSILPGVELLKAQERDHYPIGLSVEDFGQGLGLTAQVVQPIDPDRVCGYMQQALYGLVEALEAAPEQPVRQLEVLPSEERALLLQTWNATQQDYPAHLCIHQLFEAQAELTPDATAVVGEEQTLSYMQLNAQANRLAHHLRDLGVGPNRHVALYAQRDPQTVIGMLATLKAGGAYVPLDPAYPPERLAYMVADSVPIVLLSVGKPHTEVMQGLRSGVPVLDLHKDTAQWANRSINNLDAHELALDTQDVAYVIYTSGSTGQPKGVMVPHQGVVNLVTAMARKLGITAQDRMLQFASLSFDTSVEEIFRPLTQGAAVVLRTDAWLVGSQRFWSLCDANRVSVVNLPVQFWAQLSQEKVPVAKSVRAIIIGGDALSATAHDTWFASNGCWPRLWNFYGPTETTVTAIVHEVTRHKSSWRIIGRPIDNTRVYLLDADSQPVPLGAVGELYIGGAGVARGYLNRPELTAERFVPDPFSAAPDARMYKTGDLARYLPNGNLEYLGRNDQQVKIRGFRIEPSEIEARLTEHPQVRDAVVLARGEGNEKRLIAYVVAKPDENLVSALRAHVAACLPEYMVPTAFVRLDAFPLTPNGKLDRRALPMPNEDAFAHQAYEAPQGKVETALAAIWAELLGVERVSRHDSFFALGGHSLLAVQLIERLRRRGLGLSVRALFDTPTLSALAQSVGQQRDVMVPPNVITPDTIALTPEMLPLIKLTQSDIDRIVEQVPKGVANIQDIYALSPLQDGILFHHLLASDGDPYLLIVQLAFDSRALLDRYLHAVQQVIHRHDILRTAFVWQGLTIPAQVVWRYAPLSVTELTLDPVNGPIAEQLARRFDPRQHRLDLTQAPLLHCAVAQNTDGRWLLVQQQHHLVGDHSTLEVMHTEIQAFIEGQGRALPEAQPFRNLVAQAKLGVSEDEHAKFFTEMLADVEEPTLPFGLANVHRDGAPPSEAYRMLPQTLNDRLRALAKRLKVSLASLCHLAWAQVLARASGQPRVVFGTVLFGRMQGGSGADSAMGLFINTLPLRVELPRSVQDSVRETHTRLAALLEHEHASLALAQRYSGVPAGTPLFSALLNYRHHATPSDAPNLPSGIELLGAQERTNYPLSLSIEDDGQTLGLTAQVAQPLDPERVCGYMQQTLASLAKALEQEPDTPVQQLEVLPEIERQLLLETWNATQQTYPAHLCVHQLFEAQAERTPEATALVYEDQTLSYAELNARANRWAHELIELGVKPDARVAICLERSPAMVVGLLAILKAGGAYVPLDPTYAGERLVHIVQDAAPDIVLADAAGRAALGDAALADRTVLDPNRLPDRAETNPSVPSLTPRHLAYVIYTSGSTGMPKGVMVEHAQVVRLFEATQPWYHFDENDTWCLFHSFAFDFSVWEIWGALRHGGKLIIVPYQMARSPQDFHRLVCEQGVTVLNQTPSAFKAWIASQAQSPLRDQLRYVIFGGEALEPSILQAWYATRAEQSPQLVNMYGITEATVHVTYRPLRPEDSTQGGSPIGVRIPDLKLYLLDAYQQPVPLGAVGELYIGGAGVARGYLNRPELTAERFVSDPFSAEPDARMYKTGDLARYLPDGNLEFLGRNDHQVKIRGFRIELGEIEACLARHVQVHDAVVLARGEGQAKRLVAYVVAEPDDALAGNLRTHVSAALPEYMVPSAFIRLDALPLTPNGKLDRRALPAPDAEAFAHQAYEAPQGELEATLAKIWAELLGVEKISRHDSFFALGGHSLLAVQMISRSCTTLGISIPMPVLFEAPTLAALVQRVSAQDNVQDKSFAVVLPIQPRGVRPPLFCVHPVTGLSWHYRGLANHLEADQPLYGLQARGLDGVSSPAFTIEAMAMDYIQQIRRIQPHGPYCLLGWSFGGKVVHSMATQLEQQGERVALLAVLDATPDHVQQDNEPEITEDDFYHLFVRHAVGSLSEAGHYLWEKTRAVLQNNVQLVQCFSPRIYSGDMLFFRATMAQDALTQPISPKVWQPYVMGNIEVHDIACQHYDMALPVPTAQIGRILRQKLNALHGDQEIDNKKTLI
ncbi:non-ribosomal peptide synthetase [Mycetohabitans sp. B6]|uniref:non-ribosomal peptide synthetase n=2 Tax=unclassified Mycetohabitans TaxID=2622646 RepID=UPI001F1EC2E5|nr:non-ribosomal peptide synthetase [Mycetohabitans sp. B6]MCG1048623.1 amino acid adenylation domain-containing protein [Mycetohabitans sp. B6]